MVRPLKDFKYKTIGGSIAQYKKGVYVGSIPHDLLYQLLELKNDIGKEAFLVKVSPDRELSEKGRYGKINRFARKE